MKLNEKGVTLVEILVAITIFAVGLLSIATMQITSIKANSSARLRTEGVGLAQDTIEGLLARQISDPLFSGGATTVTSDVDMADSGTYTITYTVTPNSPTSDLARLDVQAQQKSTGKVVATFSGYKRLK